MIRRLVLRWKSRRLVRDAERLCRNMATAQSRLRHPSARRKDAA